MGLDLRSSPTQFLGGRYSAPQAGGLKRNFRPLQNEGAILLQLENPRLGQNYLELA